MRRRASLAAFAVLAEVVAGERRGAAAVQVDSTLQESVFDQAGLDSPNLTIGDGPARLLVVAVATGNPAAVVRHITWSGAALTRLDARVLAAPAGPCRLELWTLIDPASGASSLQVSLSASAGFGLGAVVYTGVDAEEPLGPARWQSGSGGRIALDVPAPGERPVLGAACLGGHWNGGPTASTPEAEPGPGETDFWNFTEPGVVGLGSHRVTMNGQARVSWNVTGSAIVVTTAWCNSHEGRARLRLFERNLNAA